MITNLKSTDSNNSNLEKLPKSSMSLLGSSIVVNFRGSKGYKNSEKGGNGFQKANLSKLGSGIVKGKLNHVIERTESFR